MTVIVTGAAGFIGFHVCQALLARGQEVVGIDSLNEYYDVRLKRARLALLQPEGGFRFELADVADRDARKSRSRGCERKGRRSGYSGHSRTSVREIW